MEKFIKECRKEIVKRNLIIIAIIGFILFVILFMQGSKMVNYIAGAKDFDSFADDLIVSETHQTKDMEDLKNQYVKLDIDLIVGSYAEYGMDNTSPDYVYYLYPMNNQDYYITIIANQDYIDEFDTFEEAFYNRIMNDENVTLPDAFQIEGGFQKLSDEALQFALEFFESEEDGITTIADLGKIMSPYGVIIDEMDTTPIFLIPVCIVLCGLLLGAIIVLLILSYTGPQLKTITADIEAFDENERNHIDEDFTNATILNKIRFGEQFYYVKSKQQYRIFAYNQQIWIFKKQSINVHRPAYSLYAYNNKGKAFVIAISENEQEIEVYVTHLYEHCEQAIFGEQAELWNIANRNPQELVEKIKEMKPDKKSKQPEKEDENKNEEELDETVESKDPKQKKEPKKERTVVK